MLESRLEKNLQKVNEFERQLENQLTESGKNIAGLRTEITQKEGLLNSKIAEIQRFSLDLSNLREEFSSQKLEKESFFKQSELLKNELLESQRDLNIAQIEIEAANEEKHRLKKNMSEKSSEILAVKENFELKIKNLKEDLDVLQSTKEIEIQQLQDDIEGRFFQIFKKSWTGFVSMF